MTSAQVLSRRAVNRALLARQLLLERQALPAGEPDRTAQVIQTIEHLIGLQAQAPFPPYYGLYSRLDGFRPEDLATLITDRSVVRIALMRGTIHLVSARDCLPLRRLLQPVIERGMRGAFGKQLAGVDPAELAAAGRRLVEAEPMTFAQLGQALAAQWPDHPPAALAQGVRTYVPLVQVPPRAVWGRSGQSMHTSAEHWLGRRHPPGEPAYSPSAASPAELAQLVTRYLGAFGPATVRDVQAWSGLTGFRDTVEKLRPGLRTFQDERGRELFDVPDGPLPDADTPAPPRFLPEYDNLLIGHADRTRVIDYAYRYVIFTGTLLVDGFVQATWTIKRGRNAATLTIEPLRRLSKADRVAVAEEGERLLAFAASEASGRVVRITAVASSPPQAPQLRR